MNEIEATAKATEEVAKTSGKAIEVMRLLGEFTAKVMGEPIEVTVGILTDRLRFIRWQRQLRLYEQWKAIVEERNIDIGSASLAPKLGLPIIEYATLEENDYLQDIWARLLASSMDPRRSDAARSAFIDIVKQLEVIDAKVLNGIHSLYRSHLEDSGEHAPPSKVGISKEKIIAECSIDEQSYEEVLDNLFRLRLCAPYVVTDKFDVVRNDNRPDRIPFSAIFQYETVCITALGISFFSACMQ